MTDRNPETADDGEHGMDAEDDFYQMTEDDLRRTAESVLRRRAEAELQKIWSDDQVSRSVDDTRRLLHELRVHQLELELQNEDLRQTQVALDVSRSRYFDLYDLAPIGYVTLSEQGLILEANLGASVMLGIPRGRLVATPLTRFIVFTDQDIYYQYRKKLIETGEPQMCELRMKKANGEEMWARLDATMAQDRASGKPICRTTLSDITETRNLQVDLARADRMASMGVLAASVAHEINNPLMYMLHNLESLSTDLPSIVEVVGKFREALRELVGSETLAEIAGENAKLIDPVALESLTAHADHSVEGVRRISMITKGLNSFSRPVRESLSMVDLNHAVERAVEMTANEVKCRAVMRKDLGSLPGILASDVELSQVFVNLIINAAHAIDEGAAQDNGIAIRTWSDADHVLAEVTDTGCGIPGEHLDSIFEPFFTTKGPERGTGLGLAITRRIVANFGGDIQVESTVGKGTRFRVRFPIRQSEATKSPATATKAPGIRGRIMVIDDEAHIREVLVSMLAREHDIVAVGSGQEAKEILEADPRFDLILCDLMMPNVSGIDLHEWITNRRPSLAKQLVFMSGGVFTPRTDAYLRRVDHVLLDKPFNRARLRVLVGEKLVAAARHKA